MKKLTIVTLIAMLAACGGAEERKAAYMERAKTYEAEANYDKARIEYQNALQIDPKDIPARYAMAQAMEHLNQWQNAAGHYQYIINEDAKHTGARYHLGRIYLAARSYDKSLELAEDALRIDASYLDAKALRGAALAKKGDAARGMQDALAVLEKDPGHKEAVALAASLYLNDKQDDKAIALLQEGIKRNPQEAALQILLGSIYLNRNENEKGVAIFRDIVKLEPANLGHRARLAALMMKLGKVDEAEAALRQGVSDNADNVQAKLLLVDFLAKQMGKERAEKQLHEYIEAEPKNEALRNGLAGLYLGVGDVDKAKQVYQELIDKDISEAATNDARVHLAEVLVKQNDNAGAEKLLDEVLTKNARHNDALMLRGAIYLNRRDAAKAIADFRAVLRDQPNVVKIYENLAHAHLLNSEYEQAIDNMQRAVELEPDNRQLREHYAGMLMQMNRIDAAIEQYQTMVRAEDRKEADYGTLVQLLLRKGDRVEVAKIIDQAEVRFPGSHLAPFLQGVLAQVQGDYKGSIPPLQKALGREPKNVEVIGALCKAYLADKNFGEAQSLLDRKLGEGVDPASLHNIKGELLVLDRKPAQAVDEFNRVLALKKDWVKPYQNLAAAYYLQNKPDQVAAIYERGLKNTKDDSALVIGLATFYEKTDADKAIALYETYLAKDPESAPLANNLAMLLVTSKTDAKSKQRAMDLVQPLTRLQDPAYQDTVGWVLYMNEKYERAVVILEQAVQAAPEQAIFNYHLGMAYQAQGNKDKAKAALQKAVAGKTEYPGKQQAMETLGKL